MKNSRPLSSMCVTIRPISSMWPTIASVGLPAYGLGTRAVRLPIVSIETSLAKRSAAARQAAEGAVS
jgi:hypothetical protein